MGVMPKRMPPEVREWFRKQGAKAARWGSEGGKAAAANMTPEQRIARAKRAVAAREAKRAARKVSRKSHA